MTGDSLRDNRDSIQAKIEALTELREVMRSELGVAQATLDDMPEKIDRLSDEIAHLEAELDEADAAVARADPELGPWGRDGL